MIGCAWPVGFSFLGFVFVACLFFRSCLLSLSLSPSFSLFLSLSLLPSFFSLSLAASASVMHQQRRNTQLANQWFLRTHVGQGLFFSYIFSVFLLGSWIKYVAGNLYSSCYAQGVSSWYLGLVLVCGPLESRPEIFSWLGVPPSPVSSYSGNGANTTATGACS